MTTYSWGEFFDTVSTCDEYTDEQKEKFAIFEALNKAENLKQVRKALKQHSLTETEINYLNSPCLDGILASAKYKKPLQKLIKSHSQYTETCKYYLEKGISKRCLCMASKYGRTKIVELLLNIGADIHAGYNLKYFHCKDQALRRASINGCTETVKLLLDRGADIHTYDDEAFRWACQKGHTETVKLLLDRGSHIDVLDGWALRVACIHNYIETVKLLLDRGANIHIENDRPIYLATKYNHVEIVKLLLERGAPLLEY
jgi:hypothetical protein